MKIHAIVIAAAALMVAAVGPEGLHAQATAGYVSGEQKVLSTIDLPDGRTIKRILFELTVIADDPSIVWHLGSQDCLATYEFAADESLIGGRAFCDFVSPEGDVGWATIEASGTEPVRWEFIGGTGKLAGIGHAGTTVTQAEWGDGKFVGRWEGTMTTE